MSRIERYLAWGRVHRHGHDVVRPTDAEAARVALTTASVPALAYGRGRSYGDSCLNADGLLLDTGGLDYFIHFDSTTGLLQAQAGVRLAEVLACVCRPAQDGSAWFPPVVPGTRWVSLGGAVANDVHGKNHHRFGSFGCHVPGFTLLRSDGRTLGCSPEENAELYRATIGGLGLTGLILDLKLQLRRVPGLLLVAEDLRMGSLDEFYALSAESEPGWEYSVAWVDCLARGSAVGRGIFSRANHVPGPVGPTASLRPRLSVPLAPPFLPLNRSGLRLFNSLYARRLGWRQRSLRLAAYAPVLFPLDAVGSWNLLYGRRGFYQHQCVLPPEAARDGVAEMLETVARAGQGSFLAVLKTLGTRGSPGLLSFPMPGTTLALDLPNRGAPTLALLERLDDITLAARGRVYPAKDARMSAAVFAAGQPGLARFSASVDPGFSSSFWRRVIPAGAAAPATRDPALVA
jgi:FAD/FMN-containing dehydrogenase